MSRLIVRFKHPTLFILVVMLLIMLIPSDSILACHLERIEIYPEVVTIMAGACVTYTAEAFDNEGSSMGYVTSDTAFSIESIAGGYWSPHNTYYSEHVGIWQVTGEYNGKLDTVSLIVETNLEPEIDISGKGNSIPDGDMAPSFTDDTDFGAADVIIGTVDNIFTIHNTGDAALNLTGNPIVSVSGPHAANFTVIAQPSTTIISSGGTTTFTVRFNPSDTDLRQAVITIDNDDADENPYNFAVQGKGTSVLEPVILVHKTGPTSAYVYDEVTYTITVTHSISSDGSPIYVEEVYDSIASFVDYISGDDGDTYLESGETWIYEAKYEIQPGDPDPLENEASVWGHDKEGNIVGDSDTHSLDILHLEYIEISLDPVTVTAGEYVVCMAEAFDENDNSLGDVTSGTAFEIELGALGNWFNNTYMSEKSGMWTVTGTFKGKSDSALLVVTSGPHTGFVFNTITSPQIANVPFSVTIRAIDDYGNAITTYFGTATLTDLSGTITPSITSLFIGGVYKGDVVITTAYLADSISAVDKTDSSIAGTSNDFNVVTGSGDVVDAEFFTVNFLGEITMVPIADNGALLSTLEAPSPDGSHQIVIQQGTVVTNAGNVVTLIEVTEADSPGLLDNTVLLGNAYNFQPAGSHFSIPAAITLSYDENKLPQNTVSVALEYFTDRSGWIELVPPSGIVAELGKKTGLTNHFTIFAVLASVDSGSGSSIDQAVAKFLLSDLVVTPSVSKIWEFLKFVVTTGENAVITIKVMNIGGEDGSYTAFLKLDGTIVATQKVSLDPGQTETITFNVGPNEPGIYQVEIGGLIGEFESSLWINWMLILGLPAGLTLLVLILWYLRKKQKAQAG